MSTAAKNIVAELNKSEKLNGDNYEIWSMKIQYVLEEQEVLETLNNVMVEPEQGNTTQHKRDLEDYKAWKRKNSLKRILYWKIQWDFSDQAYNAWKRRMM